MAVDVVTFGCRLNAFESEVIKREAEGAGIGDAIVINTCAVTMKPSHRRVRPSASSAANSRMCELL